MAEEKSLPRRMYEKVMGTPEQNEEAQKRMDARDKKHPDTIPAKVNRVVDKVIGRKAGGSIKASASRRGDGIAQRGKTKGRMV
jgi:tetrahydromethanopterin S-methyltransferase subunit G